MPAKIIDGRLVSDFLLKEVSGRVQALKKQKIHPKLVIILVGENPSSLSYIRQKTNASLKAGIECVLKKLDEKTTTEKLINLINRLNKDKSVHGILVQLPLPPQIETPLVIRAIDPMKDVDGFHAYNMGKMVLSAEFEDLAPCTARGIIELLKYYKLPVAGKNVVVIGRSNIVGKPVAIMLTNRDATVTICHSKTQNLKDYTKKADILIVAVGKPYMVGADMVKPSAVVIDVGVTKVENKLAGDVNFEEVGKKASWITPVPGGVGPMTVACLMENVCRATARISKK